MHKKVIDFAYGFLQGEIRLSARRLFFPLNIFALINFTYLAVKTNFNISLLQQSRSTVHIHWGAPLRADH